ncbi:GNAT family N-acetyltransferase [Nocardia carnea]|uniref:GNAT family N-acetyltransferase n=1 Tax=Nocardia carnea TaxID=37328 RepID=UPI0024586433|nr:GNAT family N-acetyltransferase [Nocardia carnea]
MYSEPVELVPLTEDNLGFLLDAAVRDADPLEVMPPVADEPGWTHQRKQAFLEFHRGRALRAGEPTEYTYLISVDGLIVGAARLEPNHEGLEAGIWIGRSHRGRRVGAAVAERLRELASGIGAQRLIAVTTVDNAAARKLLGGATTTVDGDAVTASLDLG